MKAYNAKRLVVSTEKSIRMFTADEQKLALLNLAVPSPIFSDTDPILASSSQKEREGGGECLCKYSENDVCEVKQVVRFFSA